MVLKQIEEADLVIIYNEKRTSGREIIVFAHEPKDDSAIKAFAYSKQIEVVKPQEIPSFVKNYKLNFKESV